MKKLFVKEEPDGEWKEFDWEGLTPESIIESYKPGEVYTYSYKVMEVDA